MMMTQVSLDNEVRDRLHPLELPPFNLFEAKRDNVSRSLPTHFPRVRLLAILGSLCQIRVICPKQTKQLAEL